METSPSYMPLDVTFQALQNPVFYFFKRWSSQFRRGPFIFTVLFRTSYYWFKLTNIFIKKIECIHYFTWTKCIIKTQKNNAACNFSKSDERTFEKKEKKIIKCSYVEIDVVNSIFLGRLRIFVFVHKLKI